MTAENEIIEVVQGIPLFKPVDTESLLNGLIDGNGYALESTKLTSGDPKAWVDRFHQAFINNIQVELVYPSAESTGLIKERKRVVAAHALEEEEPKKIELFVISDTIKESIGQDDEED